MSEIPPPAELRAPIALWRDARMFLCNLHLAWQNPEDIAARGYVSRKIHALIASWIRVAEAVMRHLLMIEAAALGPPAPSPARRSRAPCQRKLIHFSPDKPEEWRVSLRALDRRRPAGGVLQLAKARQDEPNRRRDAGGPRVYSTWPLALRYAAVLRAFNEPIPYARRLARRLHAHPERVEPLLRAPPEYVHRIDRAEAIRDAAERAWPRRHDSS